MVNTFLIGSFEDTARILDKKHRFKQSIEAQQIITIITKLKEGNNEKIGFSNHPIVQMWKDYLPALKYYYNLMLYYAINIDKVNTNMKYFETESNIEMPWFLYFPSFIYSHRARLYQKNPEYYKDKFTFPSFYLNIGYIWTCRHPKEIYLAAISEEDICKLADPLSEHYINPKYCPAVIKSGIRKGSSCGNILKSSTFEFCGMHNK